MKLPEEIIGQICCPRCLNRLIKEKDLMKCNNLQCFSTFPIINNIPILINEEKSVFNTADFIEQRNTTFDLKKSKLHSIASKLTPSISKNLKAKVNYKKLLSLLLSTSPNPKVLVVGGSIIGEGMEVLLSDSAIVLVEGDITFGPRTQIIFDAHNIPFPDEYFDGVIIQAVLEHVIDPYRCVEEVQRVLLKDGLVYAETPFMQQVHMGKYDYNRFTHLGHRRLFRNFSEIESGAVCGPGMALAWAYSHFIYSFSSSRKIRKYLIPFAHFTSFFWKYFDYFLIDKPGTLDSASGYFFMGKKSADTLDDRSLLKLYKGLL